MPPLRIAIQTASLREPFKKALVTASRLEADGVEIDARTEVRGAEMSQTGIRQLRKMLEDLNLRVAAVGFPTRRGYDDLEDLDRRIAATCEAMRMAYQLGARVVINRMVSMPSDADPTRRELLGATLAELGRQGQRLGARLALRTAGPSADEFSRLFSELPEQAIGVSFDPHGLILSGDSTDQAATRLGPHVVYVHANDAVRDLSLGRGVEVTLGRGSADFPSLLGRLEECGYRGWFAVERRECDDPEPEIAAAVQYLRSL